ncbi:MAG TPA: C4-dicarboxylate TRAP transporter substrate-binding protein [Gammaproteobacteria bacterium]
MRGLRHLAIAAAAAVATVAAGAAAGAEPTTIKLTIASSHSTGLPWVGVMHTLVVPESNRRLAAMGSPYRIRWVEAYGGSLYKYDNTLEAVEIGLTDMGWVGTLWELSKLPLQNVTYYTPFATDDTRMLYQVMNDLHDEVPEFAAAWTEQNQRFLGASALDTYHLLTNFPVDEVEDLRGRKILAPGPSAAWLEGTGAVPVDGGLTTYYTQIQTGVADGVLTILTGALPYRIQEVAPYVTLVGIGAQVSGAMSINLDTWNRLPPDVQQVLDELGEEYSEGVAAEVIARYERGLETLRKEGAIISTLPIEEKRKWVAGLPNIARSWAEATEKRGIPAIEALERYMDAIRKRGATPLRNWDDPG